MSTTTFLPQAYPLAVAWWDHFGDWSLPTGPGAAEWLARKIRDEFSDLVVGWQITTHTDPNEAPIITLPVTPSGVMVRADRLHTVYATSMEGAVAELVRSLLRTEEPTS